GWCQLIDREQAQSGRHGCVWSAFERKFGKEKFVGNWSAAPVDFVRRRSTYGVKAKGEHYTLMATSVTFVHAHQTKNAVSSHRLLSIGLWGVQALLALIFVFSGSMKLVMPADMLEAQTPLPLMLVRFIGICEVTGALGL